MNQSRLPYSLYTSVQVSNRWLLQIALSISSLALGSAFPEMGMLSESVPTILWHSLCEDVVLHMAFVQSLTVPKIVLVQEQTCSKYLLNKWTVYPFTSASLKSSHAFQHYFFWVLATPLQPASLSVMFIWPRLPSSLVVGWSLHSLYSHLWACLLKAPQATVTLILENPTW